MEEWNDPIVEIAKTVQVVQREEESENKDTGCLILDTGFWIPAKLDESAL
jgi:hypothetical protein